MKKIDIDTWGRKDIYRYYQPFEKPRFSMTFHIDVTNFYNEVKKKKVSFYLSFIHFIMEAINESHAFKYRIVNHEVICYNEVHPSFTNIIEQSEQFRIITLNHEKKREDFLLSVNKKRIEQGTTFMNEKDEMRQDLIYISTFPWANFSQITHAEKFNPNDSIPRVVWGKWEERDGKKWMPLNIEVHHGFVDGYHLGMFIQNITEKLIKI